MFFTDFFPPCNHLTLEQKVWNPGRITVERKWDGQVFVSNLRIWMKYVLLVEDWKHFKYTSYSFPRLGLTQRNCLLEYNIRFFSFQVIFQLFANRLEMLVTSSVWVMGGRVAILDFGKFCQKILETKQRLYRKLRSNLSFRY